MCLVHVHIAQAKKYFMIGTLLGGHNEKHAHIQTITTNNVTKSTFIKNNETAHHALRVREIEEDRFI